MKKRKGRRGPRPLAIRKSMHVVLKSSKATGQRSFRNPKHFKMIKDVLSTFARQNHIQLISFANVGNHIHLHIQLNHRDGYKRFIRAVTGVIAMKVMNWSRWTKRGASGAKRSREGVSEGRRRRHGADVSDGGRRTHDAEVSDGRKFWDYRPYSNVVMSWTGFLNLKDYVKINQLEGEGLPRGVAEAVVKGLWGKPTETKQIRRSQRVDGFKRGKAFR